MSEIKTVPSVSVADLIIAMAQGVEAVLLDTSSRETLALVTDAMGKGLLIRFMLTLNRPFTQDELEIFLLPLDVGLAKSLAEGILLSARGCGLVVFEPLTGQYHDACGIEKPKGEVC